MNARQLLLDFHKKIIVDLFAGGGGMSLSFEKAFGRSPDIAGDWCKTKKAAKQSYKAALATRRKAA